MSNKAISHFERMHDDSFRVPTKLNDVQPPERYILKRVQKFDESSRRLYNVSERVLFDNRDALNKFTVNDFSVQNLESVDCLKNASLVQMSMSKLAIADNAAETITKIINSNSETTK